MSNKGIYSEIAPWYDELFPVGEEQAAFFKRLFRESWCRSVMDLGCGTGRHLELFGGMGLRLAGLEPEADMAKAAIRRLKAAGLEAELAVCGLEEGLGSLAGDYGAAVCLGNTLAHLDSAARLAAGLNVVSRLLKPWGLFVTQTVNFDAVLASRRSPFADKRIEDPVRGGLVFRRDYLFDEAPERLIFRLELSGEGLDLAEDIPLKPYGRDEQIRALESCGFKVGQVYGDWDGREQAADSPAIIIVARRAV